ncbi:hypothetical protein EV363DRAFT_1176519, partial [Boletus edulis]
DEATPHYYISTVIRTTGNPAHLVIVPTRRRSTDYPDGTIVFSNDSDHPPSTAHLTSLICYDHVKRFYFTHPDTAHRVLRRLSLVVATYKLQDNRWVQI